MGNLFFLGLGVSVPGWLFLLCNVILLTITFYAGYKSAVSKNQSKKIGPAKLAVVKNIREEKRAA